MALTITNHGNGVFEIIGTTATRQKVVSGLGLIRHIFWNGPSTDGHKARIEDKDSKLIWNAEAGVVTEGSVGARDLNFDRGCNELWIADLDSGELTVITDQFQER